MRAAALVAVCLLSSLACSWPAAPENVQKNAKAPATKSELPSPPKIVWAAAPKESATIESMEVRVTGARIGNPRVKSAFDRIETELKEPYLIVYLHVKNRSDTKIIKHFGWTGSIISRNACKITDNFSNTYFLRDETGTVAVDGVKTFIDSIYPGKEADDVALFQPPVDKAKELKLELSAPSELQGTFRFAIPMSMVKRSD